MSSSLKRLNVIQMTLKWLFFFRKKIARIAQQLGALLQGPRSSNLLSHTQSSQLTIIKIVITRFLKKRMW